MEAGTKGYITTVSVQSYMYVIAEMNFLQKRFLIIQFG